MPGPTLCSISESSLKRNRDRGYQRLASAHSYKLLIAAGTPGEQEAPGRSPQLMGSCLAYWIHVFTPVRPPISTVPAEEVGEPWDAHTMVMLQTPMPHDHPPSNTAASAGPGKAPIIVTSMVAASEQDESEQRYLSEAEQAENQKRIHPLWEAERKVAADLLAYVNTAMKGGKAASAITKQVLISNIPSTKRLLELLPDSGELPSLKQLEGLNTLTLKSSLQYTSRLCVAADSQPMDVITRSAECLANITAQRSEDRGKYATRQQRLQAVKASLASSSAAQPKAMDTGMGEIQALLAQHGIPEMTCGLIAWLIQAIAKPADDKTPVGAAPTAAGSGSTFSARAEHIDGMLPGERSITNT